MLGGCSAEVAFEMSESRPIPPARAAFFCTISPRLGPKQSGLAFQAKAIMPTVRRSGAGDDDLTFLTTIDDLGLTRGARGALALTADTRMPSVAGPESGTLKASLNILD